MQIKASTAERKFIVNNNGNTTTGQEQYGTKPHGTELRNRLQIVADSAPRRIPGEIRGRPARC
jgi:hypothetical protein